ncbi:MAG: 50S ribosomal protein L3 [Spirochaetaceae bacterium]|jgi:large subunit ribosomal protein L3|nr:50S ribosomal protein L3 [Spirochaetaceae bacterium]
MLGLLTKKIGMTQVFDGDGNLIPVTVLRVDANTVIAQREKEKHGYNAVVLGVDDAKPARVNKPEKGQYPEGIALKRHVREFRDFPKECKIGDTFGEEIFENCRYVDVIGVSKGKGFQGVVKRWGFGGGRKTHGSKFHREPGSTGQSTYPHKTFKNVKLPGRMGREQVTALSLRVIKLDKENHLILVHGAVPGIKKSVVVVRAAVKKQGA